jgi:hypothetical protein
MKWLATLPLEVRLTLPDGTKLLGVHAAPGTADGPGLHPGLEDAEIQTAVEGCDADLVCIGHTHVPMDRIVAGKRVVTLGSVSLPGRLEALLKGKPAMGEVSVSALSSPYAGYVLLEADASGYTLRHRFVSYDLEALIDAIRQSGHATSEYLMARFQR